MPYEKPGSITVTFQDGTEHEFTSIEKCAGLDPEQVVETDEVLPDISSTSEYPVQSKAIHEALAGKADLVDGKVPSSQLPSYVDDVVEYPSVNDFPATGEAGKIYLALDTGFTYRWSGSVYVRVNEPDLSNYYTKGQTDALLNAKLDKSSALTDQEIEAAWNEYVPPDPVLANNSWKTIKAVSKSGNIPATWQVGDTKTLTYDGTTFTARLVDKTGKFTRVADNSTAYLSFELTESLATLEKFNSNGSNVVVDSALLASMNSGTIWNNLDSTLTSVLEEVNVKVSESGGSATVINFQAKVFLGREHDLFSNRSYCSVAEWNAITQDEYYQIHDADADKVKIQNGSTAFKYYLMSPHNSSPNTVAQVTEGGICNTTHVGLSRAVALRFAL